MDIGKLMLDSISTETQRRKLERLKLVQIKKEGVKNVNNTKRNIK